MTNEDAKDVYDRLRALEKDAALNRSQLEGFADRFEKMVDRMDAHWERMWKLVYVLVGAVIALAIGPKAVEKITAAMGGGYTSYIAPMNHDRHLNKGMKA